MSKMTLSEYWTASASMSATAIGKEALDHAIMLSTKVCALLTHVTLMMAVSTWFLSFSFGKKPESYNTALIEAVNATIFMEIILYLITTLLCLRAIWVTAEFVYNKLLPVEDAVNIRCLNILKRQRYYLIAMWITVGNSLFFLASLIVKYIIISSHI